MPTELNDQSGEPPDMLVLMSEIDSLDRKLVELLSRRFNCSREVGFIKRESCQPPYDPTRIRDQQLNFVRQCVEANLDGRMASKLIDVILQQVVAERFAPTWTPHGEGASVPFNRCGQRDTFDNK